MARAFHFLVTATDAASYLHAKKAAQGNAQNADSGSGIVKGVTKMTALQALQRDVSFWRMAGYSEKSIAVKVQHWFPIAFSPAEIKAARSELGF